MDKEKFEELSSLFAETCINQAKTTLRIKAIIDLYKEEINKCDHIFVVDDEYLDYESPKIDISCIKCGFTTDYKHQNDLLKSATFKQIVEEMKQKNKHKNLYLATKEMLSKYFVIDNCYYSYDALVELYNNYKSKGYKEETIINKINHSKLLVRE